MQLLVSNTNESAGQLRAKAEKIKENSAGSGSIQASSDLIASYADQILKAVSTITNTQLTSKVDNIKDEAAKINSKINRSQTEQPRSLKQFFDVGYTSFDWKNAASVFNIGEPADGIYTFNFKCPKVQAANPSYTVTYRSDCDQLRRSGLSAVPKDIKADPDSLAGVPTEKLGLQITGVKIGEGTGKVDAKLIRDKDGVPNAVIWKLTDVYLYLKNTIKSSDDDISVCSLQGAGVNQNVNFEDIDKEIKLIGLNIDNNKIGTIVYSCTKTPATGTPMTESIGVRLKLDTQSDPAGLKIVDAIEINPLQAAAGAPATTGQYSIKFKIQGFGGLRLKAEFVQSSGGAIDLGEITLKSVQAPVKYSTESFDSSVSKTYYEYTSGASSTLSGKIRVTAIDNPALKAEKDVQFTLSARSTAQTGGWKIDGRPIGAGVQEKDFVSVTLHDTVDPKTQKHTVTLNGQVTQGTPPTKVKIVYNDNVNKDEVTVEPQVTGGTFKWDLAVVNDASAINPTGVYKLTKLEISADGFTTVDLPRDLQLSAAPPAGGAEYVDVDPNTKFRDIPATDVAAGKYKVVLVDGSEKVVKSIAVNADAAALSHDEGAIVILDNKKGNEITIRQAISQSKLNGLKVKR